MYISSSKCLETEINTVARDGNFYFKKASLGTVFSACNCLLDSRNCLLPPKLQRRGLVFELNLVTVERV